MSGPSNYQACRENGKAQWRRLEQKLPLQSRVMRAYRECIVYSRELPSLQKIDSTAPMQQLVRKREAKLDRKIHFSIDILLQSTL